MAVNYGLYNQISYPQNADRAYAGLARQIDKVDSYSHAAALTRQTVAIDVGTEANDTVYSISALGETVSYTSDGSATTAEIVAGLVAAIKLNPQIYSRFTVAATDADTLTLTARDYGVDTTVTVSGGGTGYAATNTASATGSNIGFGYIVAKSTTVAVDGKPTIRLPSGSSDIIAGVTMATKSIPRTDAATRDSAYRPQDNVNVLSRGVIWVVAEVAIALNSTLYFRYSSGTLGVVAASSGTGKAALSGFSVEEASTTLPDGTIIVPLAVNLP